MRSVNFEIYDHQMGSFSRIPPEDTITIEKALQQSWPDSDSERDVFMIAPMYDIPETMIRALKQLDRYPRVYAVVYQISRVLEEIVNAQTGANLIFEATLLTTDRETKEKILQSISPALGAGCVGALIDVDPVTLDAYSPDALFLRRIIT